MNKRLEAYSKILFLIYMFLIVLFIYLSLESGADSSDSSSIIAKFVSDLFNVPNTENFQNLIRKLIGHFLYFAILGLISTAFFESLKYSEKTKIILNYSINILFIFSTEFLFQLIAKDRGPSIRDCLIDFGGFFLFSFLIYLIYFSFKYYDKIPKKILFIYKIIIITLYVLSIILYIILSSQNGDKSGELSKEVSSGVSGVGGAIAGTDVNTVTANINSFVRKLLGHFGYFTMIGFFSILAYLILNIKARYKFILHFSIGISLAFITEFVIENLALKRGPSIKDFYINSLGFIFSSLIIIYVVYTVKYILGEALWKKEQN